MTNWIMFNWSFLFGGLLKHTLIFINGFKVPTWFSKTPFVWNDELWKGNKRIYLPSETPISDLMVRHEIGRLANLANSHPNPVVLGLSLGAWWAALLGCSPQFKGTKLVFWTPVADTTRYPMFFKASQALQPANMIVNPHNRGPNNTLVMAGSNDFIVPSWRHADRLAFQFAGRLHKLNGGHFYQNNHKESLLMVRDWIDSHS